MLPNIEWNYIHYLFEQTLTGYVVMVRAVTPSAASHVIHDPHEPWSLSLAYEGRVVSRYTARIIANIGYLR